MSELVERLADKWESWVELDEWTEATPAKDARWWLNAIADELAKLEESTPGPFRNMGAIADYLRSQATGNIDEG